MCRFWSQYLFPDAAVEKSSENSKNRTTQLGSSGKGEHNKHSDYVREPFTTNTLHCTYCTCIAIKGTRMTETMTTLNINPLHRPPAVQNLFLQLKSAPSDSLTYRLALCACLVNYNHGGLRAVAHLWQEFVLELRYRWENNYFIYGWAHTPEEAVPLDDEQPSLLRRSEVAHRFNLHATRWEYRACHLTQTFLPQAGCWSAGSPLLSSAPEAPGT